MPTDQHPYPGIFIAAEGIDGAGKTWALQQLETIATVLDGVPPVMVREPGGTPFGEALRGSLAQYRRDLAPISQLLAFNASRCELAERVIRPALEQGQTVITDRWVASTRVYQHDCPADVMETILKAATGDLLHPDLTLLFTRDPAEAVASKIAEYGESNRERELDYLTDLQERYLQQLETAPPGRWRHCPFTSMDESRHRLEHAYRRLTGARLAATFRA